MASLKPAIRKPLILQHLTEQYNMEPEQLVTGQIQHKPRGIAQLSQQSNRQYLSGPVVLLIYPLAFYPCLPS